MRPLVPQRQLWVAAAFFIAVTMLALLEGHGGPPGRTPSQRYTFVPKVTDYAPLGPNRFAYSMSVDNSTWGSDTADIAAAIKGSSGNVPEITHKSLSPKNLTVPSWANKLHPLHDDVLKLHQFRNETGRKFLMVFPFRDHPMGTVLKDAHTGEVKVVTFAERTDHLGQIIPYLERHLRKAGKLPGRDFNILVMEQANYDISFSKANVINAGARLAREWGYDYMVMHDVDFFPAHPKHAYDLPEDGLPIHYVSTAPWAKSYMQFGNHFGGAYGISVKTFFEVNGYPSGFWGWGPEDNMMMLQVFRAGGFHRLDAITGRYFAIEHSSASKRNSGLLFMNNLRRFVAYYLNRREARKVPMEGANELNATITRYAPMSHLGAVHWATVRLDTLRYRPDDNGYESAELQRKRAVGELPPLSDVGIGEDRFLMTDPPLAPHEIALVQQIRELEALSFGSNEVMDFIPVERTFGNRTSIFPQVL